MIQSGHFSKSEKLTKEVRPFIKDAMELELWTKEFFVEQALSIESTSLRAAGDQITLTIFAFFV